MQVKTRSLIGIAVCFTLGIGLTGSCLADGGGSKLTLKEAENIAFQNSQRIQMAQKEVEIAEDKVKQVRAGYWPKVTLYGGYTHFNNTPNDVELANQLITMNNGLDTLADNMVLYGQMTRNPNPVWMGLAENLEQKPLLDDTPNYYGLKLMIEQPLYTGNRLGAMSKQADANLAYAKANLNTARESVAFDVKKAYYTVIYAQRTVETLQKAVNSMEGHLHEANNYYKAGMVPKLDVIRAEVKLADLKQKLTMAVNSLYLAKKALNFTLGVDLTNDYTVDEEVVLVSVDQSLEDCKEIAIKHRLELAAIEMKINMAQENVEIARSGQRPLVGLQVKGEDTHPYASEPTVSINLVASLTIFDGGMVKNKVNEAKNVLQQAKTGKELMTRGVLLEVEQAYRNLLTAKEAVQVAQGSIEQAKEASRMAEISYQAGLCTSLEKIDAEVALTQAESNYTQALSLYNIAYAQLQKAMGIEEGVEQ